MVEEKESKIDSTDSRDKLPGEIIQNLSDERVDITDRDRFSTFRNKYQIKKIMKHVVIIGALVGFIIGQIINSFFQLDHHTHSYNQALYVLFVFGGTLTGSICAVLFSYIKRA